MAESRVDGRKALLERLLRWLKASPSWSQRGSQLQENLHDEAQCVIIDDAFADRATGTPKMRVSSSMQILLSRLEDQDRWDQVARISDLSRPSVAHSWAWHLDERKGSVLSQAEYILAVQRLGATIIRRELPHLWLEGITRLPGYTGIHVVDNSAVTEPVGLTSDTARPADILTCMARLGRQIALDICVCSKNGAGDDATEAAFRRKVE
eukprot:5604959-Amphidinium_carterae.1